MCIDPFTVWTGGYRRVDSQEFVADDRLKGASQKLPPVMYVDLVGLI